MNREKAADMHDFNWVEARSKCSSIKVFEELRVQIGEDLVARKASMPVGQRERCSLELVSPSSKSFIVRMECGNESYPSVTFNRTESGISVWRSAKLMFNATLTLGDDGQCRLKVDDKELQFWQVRRLALEDLLFGEVA